MSARADPRGGRSAMVVPTATNSSPNPGDTLLDAANSLVSSECFSPEEFVNICELSDGKVVSEGPGRRCTTRSYPVK
jgi:hypothetical protein